jgi:phosphoenolpyruvate-protein phosphotransferase (PTS system enzyme I)
VSIGFARGPFVRNAAAPNGKRLAGLHQCDLRGARLCRAAVVFCGDGGEAAQILEFQVALLEDEDLVVVLISSSQD